MWHIKSSVHTSHEEEEEDREEDFLKEKGPQEWTGFDKKRIHEEKSMKKQNPKPSRMNEIIQLNSSQPL